MTHVKGLGASEAAASEAASAVERASEAAYAVSCALRAVLDGVADNEGAAAARDAPPSPPPHRVQIQGANLPE